MITFKQLIEQICAEESGQMCSALDESFINRPFNCYDINESAINRPFNCYDINESDESARRKYEFIGGGRLLASDYGAFGL